MGHEERKERIRETEEPIQADPGPEVNGKTGACGRFFDLRTCILWLLPGLAAGFLLAVVVTYREYRSFSEVTGAFLEQDATAPFFGASENRIQEKEKQGTQTQELRKDFAAAVKGHGPEDREAGEAFLREYGYRTWGRLGTHFLTLSGICVLLSELSGWCVFRSRERKRRQQEQRIEELTRYLLAAERGKAAVLPRREDAFSCLEDAVYKAVMELKSTKEEAVRSHEVLSERIADVAHQLKTPITSMSLMTELLEDQQTEEGKECVQRLDLQIRRLRNLVHALLSLAKLESHTIRYEPENIDVEDLLDGAAEPLRELLQGRQIRLSCSGEPASIRADRQWTEEAVMNVLKNCAEHTPEGGQIRAEWEKNPLYTELRFTDSGKGFSKKELPHLFERFYRGEDAQKDSAGIGLALAKLVAEQQDGHIWAENTRDGHACFILRFYR